MRLFNLDFNCASLDGEEMQIISAAHQKQKNIVAILNLVQIDLFQDNSDMRKIYTTSDLDLTGDAFFFGEIFQTKLSNLMSKAYLPIFSSDYDEFGLTVAKSKVAGKVKVYEKAQKARARYDN